MGQVMASAVFPPSTSRCAWGASIVVGCAESSITSVASLAGTSALPLTVTMASKVRVTERLLLAMAIFIIDR